MTPRWPFLALLAVIAGVVAYPDIAELGEGTARGGVQDRRDAVPAAPPVAVAAAQPPAAFGSTWYCAGGDTVVVANPTARQVGGRLTVHRGEHGSAPGEPAGPAPGTSGPDPAVDAAGGPPTPPAPEPAESGEAGEAGEAGETATMQVLPGEGGEGGERGDDPGGPGSPGSDGSGGAAPDDRGEAVGDVFTVPPRGRRVLTLTDPGGDRPRAGAVVELDAGGVAVEQQVDRPEGSDVAPCASRTAPEWHVAWASTSRDARALLLLFNPFPDPVTVDARFATTSGVREPVRWQGLVVPAGRVLEVDLGEDVARHPQVSATVRSRGGELVVGRVQSFDGSAGTEGMSLAPGQPAPASTWTFAHGRVDERTSERIVLYNPGRRVAEVDVALTGDGAAGAGGADGLRPQPFGTVVRPGRFEVVDYTTEPRVEPGTSHATVVRSRNGVPVVAERLLTFAPAGAERPSRPEHPRDAVHPAAHPVGAEDPLDTTGRSNAPGEGEGAGPAGGPDGARSGRAGGTEGDARSALAGGGGRDEPSGGDVPGPWRDDGDPAGAGSGETGDGPPGDGAAPGAEPSHGGGDPGGGEDVAPAGGRPDDGDGDGDGDGDDHGEGGGEGGGAGAGEGTGPGGSSSRTAADGSGGEDAGEGSGGEDAGEGSGDEGAGGGSGDEGAGGGSGDERDRGEITVAAGAVAPARTWVFPALLLDDPGGEADPRTRVRLTVLNSDRRRPAHVSVAVDHDGGRVRPPELQKVRVAPGARQALRLTRLPGPASVVVVADRPVTVERTLVRHHRVLALSAGVPVP